MTTQTTEAATPETDAKASPHIGFYSCATVPAEFARKLERERDEAREAMQYIAYCGLPARFLEDFAREFLKRRGGV